MHLNFSASAYMRFGTCFRSHALANGKLWGACYSRGGCSRSLWISQSVELLTYVVTPYAPEAGEILCSSPDRATKAIGRVPVFGVTLVFFWGESWTLG